VEIFHAAIFDFIEEIYNDPFRLPFYLYQFLQQAEGLSRFNITRQISNNSTGACHHPKFVEYALANKNEARGLYYPHLKTTSSKPRLDQAYIRQWLYYMP
jgi:hypothetical protein